MASQKLLIAQQEHLSSLLEAVQRCVYFLATSDRRIPWPLTGEMLTQRQKDNDLFEALAAVNERFSKLQDTLGSAMRHALILLGEQADSFLKVLSIYEKFGVVASVEEWQSARTARNLAAHDYQTDYDIVAEHFNTLHELRAALMLTAGHFAHYCSDQLAITPREALINSVSVIPAKAGIHTNQQIGFPPWRSQACPELAEGRERRMNQYLPRTENFSKEFDEILRTLK